MKARVVGQLEILADGGGVSIGAPGAAPTRILASELVAEFVRHDDAGRYRPLSGAKTLPTGWIVRLPPGADPADVIDAVYPLAATHQRQFAEGTLELVSLEAVLDRQSGRYEATSRLSTRGRALAIDVLCGICIRRPVWHGSGCAPEEIPCPEPCSVMVSLCREAAIWEQHRPGPVAPDPAVAFAAFDEPGNELRERYLSAMIDAND